MLSYFRDESLALTELTRQLCSQSGLLRVLGECGPFGFSCAGCITGSGCGAGAKPGLTPAASTPESAGNIHATAAGLPMPAGLCTDNVWIDPANHDAVHDRSSGQRSLQTAQEPPAGRHGQVQLLGLCPDHFTPALSTSHHSLGSCCCLGSTLVLNSPAEAAQHEAPTSRIFFHVLFLML